jgi:hypothetical protein
LAAIKYFAWLFFFHLISLKFILAVVASIHNMFVLAHY